MSTTTLPPQIVMVGDAARTRKSDPVTSHLAADSNTTAVGESQLYVLDVLMWWGPMADHELVAFHEKEVANGFPMRRYSPSRLRSARSELVEQGRVAATDIDDCLTPSGRRAKVWAVSA